MHNPSTASNSSSSTTDESNTPQQPAWIIDTFAVGPLQCNCTIVGDPVTQQAIVIDPGGDVDVITHRLFEHNLTKVVKILHTHAHFDHFLASGHLREQTGAPLCLHANDRPLWDNLDKQCSLYGIPFEPVPPPDEVIRHEQPVCVAALEGQCIHTPGHTPGSTSFWFKEVQLLVAGDTLFRRSIGRTDLWGGDHKQIERSIKTRLYTLDEDATVITGHGPSTTIGEELRHNPFVNGLK